MTAGIGRAVAIGRRVFLRAPTARDREEFLRQVKASRALHRPWVHPPGDRLSYAGYLKAARSGRHLRYLVCLKPGGEIAGVVNISEIVRGVFQSGYLGFYAFASHAGKGYMTEGLELVIKHAMKDLGLHRLEANVQPTNRRSLALVRRCGFQREGLSPSYLKIAGRWRDHERWAILATGRRRGGARR